MMYLQFIGDFLTESVQILEHLACEEEPPLRRHELELIRDAFGDENSDKEVLAKRLEGMVKAFGKRGALKGWRPMILDKIDLCFEEHYMMDKEILACAFLPNSGENQNAYMKYCAGVDEILATHSDLVPPYARDYFAFYSIWEMQGYAFPMPIGTSKVVSVLEAIVNGYCDGFVEVS